MNSIVKVENQDDDFMWFNYNYYLQDQQTPGLLEDYLAFPDSSSLIQFDPYFFPQQNKHINSEFSLEGIEEIRGDIYGTFDANFSLFREDNIVMDHAKPIYATTSTPQHHHFYHHDHSSANHVNNVGNKLHQVVESGMNINIHEEYYFISSSRENNNEEEEGINRRIRQSGRSKLCGALELDDIKKYFDLPITKAAKELKVGLTVLKKRCRELNISRWPHRKIKSLKSLVDNVKELGLTNEIEMLEVNKRMVEILPELELTERTKKLRQACFKANYKKRRLILSAANS